MRLIPSRRPKELRNCTVRLRISLIKAKVDDNTTVEALQSPYIVLHANRYRFSTAITTKDLNYEWYADFEIPLSRWKHKRAFSITVWNKDKSGKRYLGRAQVPLRQLFPGKKFSSEDNKAQWIKIFNGKTLASVPEILIKCSLESFDPDENIASIWQQLVPDSIPTEGSESEEYDTGSDFEGLVSETGFLSLEDLGNDLTEDVGLNDNYDVSEFDSGGFDSNESDGRSNISAAQSTIVYGSGDASGLASEIETAMIKSPSEMEKYGPLDSSVGISSHPASDTKKKKKSKRSKHFELNTSSAVVGLAFLEIVNVTDLPPLRNMTRTGYDMDPFVVISFGRKTFRTPWLRHTLNPVFNEKLAFPVLPEEMNFSINLAVLDKDRITLNDFVADANFKISELVKLAPKPSPFNGLYNPQSLGTFGSISGSSKGRGRESQSRSSSVSRLKRFTQRSRSRSRDLNAPRSQSISRAELKQTTEIVRPISSVDIRKQLDSDVLKTSASSDDVRMAGEQFERDRAVSARSQRLSRPHTPPLDLPVSSSSSLNNSLTTFKLPLTLKNAVKWEDKHSPQIIIRGRFLPYSALRQQFWRALIRTYDIDDTDTISLTELSALLESLSATLSSRTVEGYFSRFSKTVNDELTVDEVVICLEEQVIKDSKVVHSQHSTDSNDSSSAIKMAPSSKPVLKVDTSGPSNKNLFENDPFYPEFYDQEGSGDAYSSEDQQRSDTNAPEKLICITSCPFCNRPRLNKRAEIDIVTHLATCASQEWSTDGLVMDRYVTSSQAQKRWYSKMVSKVTYGNYKLGANSANILVQDRETGYILEEKMSIYVRLGIRLLYKGIGGSNMEKRRIKRLLRSLSVKQGLKYDNPNSTRSILPFIRFHQLDMSETLEQIEKFKTFNEFFYRKLKPSARILDAPNNPRIAVSAADCRLTVFQTVTEATAIWIKGREFSISRLFGNAYPQYAERFTSGSLAIFRLAPQDYHRFHTPVDGIIGEPRIIEGEYYTVNPMAIRSALDVYGENVRVLVPIESEQFGLVMVVCVGAMMVGSTVITANKGDHLNRMDELGYFKFGGSTLVVLFEPNRLIFDQDLASNSKEALETLVRVGMSIGHGPKEKQWRRYDLASPELSSPQQKERAWRRIAGSSYVEDKPQQDGVR